MKTNAWVGVIAGLMALIRLSAAEPATAQTVSLSYHEAPYAIVQAGTFNSSPSNRFSREPDFGGRKVLYGSFHFNDGTNVVGCAWDYTQRKLHVDLNRNTDLTDDPGGVFTSSSKDEKRQTFPQIRLKLRTPSGVHACMVEASLTHSVTSGYGSLLLCSFWQAPLVIGGVTNQVGLLEMIGNRTNQPSYLVLRPWKDREAPFSLSDGTPDAFFFPSRLFYQGKAFALEGRFAEETGKEVFQLTFKEETPKFGDLKVAGKYVHRLILEDKKGYTAILDEPPEQTRLPAGTYNLSEVWVRSGTVQAVCNSGRPVEIKEGSTLSLSAGGPLTNSVSAERRRETLNMSYELLGADGGNYMLQPQDREHPPSYTIWLGKKQVASGKFAYG